ncbi:RagB/SusD family nutrient uptake outer membrane protein [Alkalitalea saponilacus]|uniref:Starch-binding associating with outer membrane n=1 Tax=Alkalitalea saponilacus TaxID=889453 RepID=A0A1T5ERS0_9BACT|nr:RagB/SusD family nutrient uptake outer membrane protein [Alkalitalea saponilacus]ASB48049.1 RagB/SusD family nutrient uptake outer membrane protein [Alkalitalea saponilacus]SKB86538.1 Starch-binding associating with outer membrane [Alkalitalea saponilacus]
MRKIGYILLILAGFAWVSCEDFLDTSSPSEFTHNVVFSSVAYTEYAIVGIYNIMTEDHVYSARLPLNFSTNSDIEFVGADANSYNDAGNRGYSNYYGIPENNHFNNTWIWLYRMIERSNLAIEGIQESPLMESNDRDIRNRMQAYLGEALALRALAYFELIKHFGDVPFKRESTKADGSNIYLPVTDRDEIYDYIISDLFEAEQILPWVNQMGYTSERITKGFVKGLIARMALYRGGYSIRNKAGFPTERGDNWEYYYEIANQQCREIMESGVHGLNPSYINIWKTLNSLEVDANFNENLFEVAHGLGQHGEMGYSIGVRFYPNNKYGYGNNTNVVNTSAYYFYLFDSTDVRRDATIAYYTYGNNETLEERFQGNPMSFNFQKWDQRWMNDAWLIGNLAASNKRGYGINWVMMRYSDVLLMFAETENALNNGPTGEAKEALKDVRRRAFAPEFHGDKVDSYVESLNNEEAFFNAIVDERAWEFGGEAIRKFDLIRWNLLVDKIAEQRQVLAQMITSRQHPVHGELPQRIFFRYEENDEIIDRSSINFYQNRGEELVEELWDIYSSVNWFDASSGNQEGWLERLFLFSSGLTQNRAGVYNRHLYPLPLNVISESQGLIEQHLGF